MNKNNIIKKRVAFELMEAIAKEKSKYFKVQEEEDKELRNYTGTIHRIQKRKAQIWDNVCRYLDLLAENLLTKIRKEDLPDEGWDEM